MANILITMGGTIVPIDKVRNISNMSHGTFGSKIAREIYFQMAGKWHLTAIVPKHGQRPFSIDININNHDWTYKFNQLGNLIRLHKYANYDELEFETFQEYEFRLLTELRADPKPDLVILTAAVSDFLVDNVVDGKIRTETDMSIKLTPARKLISMVKQESSKTKLVGFKFLAGASDKELEEAAKNSIETNGCDMVVANHYEDIFGPDAELRDMLVWPNRPTKKIRGTSDKLAREVALESISLIPSGDS